MRMEPSRYMQPAPAKTKPGGMTRLAHISAPINGLNLQSKQAVGDPLTAPILTNFNIEIDRIECRNGYELVSTHASGEEVESIIGYHGTTPRVAGACNGAIFNTLNGTDIQTGFTSNDWSWTSFSNLSQIDYTVMCNGTDGVWSWDGSVLAAGIVKEAVTAAAGDTWILPDRFDKVIAHMNRLFFADSQNLAVYYLPLQTKAGEVKKLPLNALFRRGGSIMALATWTLEGGVSMNDQLVIFSSNGEVVIYQGTDPDDLENWNLVGIFRFDAPMSKHCVSQYGGDLWVMISTGVVPMSTLLRAEGEQLGKLDQNVWTQFADASLRYRDRPGWQLMLNPTTQRFIANMPRGAPNLYQQLCRQMTKPVWSQWENVPARSWGWLQPNLYIGSDDGKVYRMHPDLQSDNGAAIRCDVQMAWSNFKTPAIKKFNMIQTYMITDGDPKPKLDMKVDYDYTLPENEPDITFAAAGAVWDVADWDDEDTDGANWTVPENRAVTFWQGTAALGRVGGPRLTALVRDCTFSVTGWDVLYEQGAALG